MAENPITSDNLTIDFGTLLSMTVGDRVQAATSNPGFQNLLMNSLTPIQLAKAFPSYYRDKLPDISNFILANRYLDEKGSAAFDQRGGGSYGSEAPGYFKGETALPSNRMPAGTPEPTSDEIKKKLLQSGIDVDKTYTAIGNGISQDDPQVKFLRDASPEKLSSMGIESYKDETGKSMYRVKDVNAEIEQMKATNTGIKPLGSVGNGLNLSEQRRKEIVFNSILQQLKEDGYNAKDIRGVAAILAGQPQQESNYDPTAQHDRDPVTGKFTGYGIYGARNDRMEDMFKWMAENGYQKDDLVGQARFMAHEAVSKPEYKKYMDGMSGLDITQLAKQDPKQFRSLMLEFTKGFEGPKYPESGLENRIRGSMDTFDMKEENIFTATAPPTPEELIQRRKDAISRELYGQASPTSTESAVVSGSIGKVNVGDFNTVATPADEWLMSRSSFSGKEQKGAEKYGMSQLDYSIRGMDPRLRMSLYEMGQQYEKETGKKFQINSAFRDDYRQSLAEGFHAETGYSRHGGSTSIGGNDAWGPMSAYGRGQAADLPIEIADWFAKQGPNSGVVRSMPRQDPYHVTSVFAQGSKETRNFDISSDLLQNIDARYNTWMKDALDQQQQNAQTTPTPKFQYGGMPKTQDDENLSVFDETGNLRWKMNSGEGIYIKPESNEYADSKIEELSGRVNEISNMMSNVSGKTNSQPKVKNEPDKNWQKNIANAVRSPGTQNRAFRRSKFRNEGWHWSRNSPNSTTA